MSEIRHGNCLDLMRDMETDSIDLVCTDPPYGYSFMGKEWDKAVPPVEAWRECLRVLKPGAFAFVMSAPRLDVQGEMARRLSEAGFRTDFTPIYWTYKSGLPKAANIGKLVDKRLGVEPIEKRPATLGMANNPQWNALKNQDIMPPRQTDEAKALDGSYAGYQPKPAVEVIMVCMKPLAESTFVDQAMSNGKGVTWLGDVRVPTDEDLNGGTYSGSEESGDTSDGWRMHNGAGGFEQPLGRFPANLLVSDNVLGDDSRYFDLDAWDNAQELPRKVRDALPFMVVPKASKGEKDEGCGGLELKVSGILSETSGQHITRRDEGYEVDPRHNHHPTVKPLTLMRYLVTLATRPGDTVLDPYAGSGTTTLAAKMLGREGIGLERDAEYVEIARARLDALADTLF